jgi:hypothetical protein
VKASRPRKIVVGGRVLSKEEVAECTTTCELVHYRSIRHGPRRSAAVEETAAMHPYYGNIVIGYLGASMEYEAPYGLIRDKAMRRFHHLGWRAIGKGT